MKKISKILLINLLVFSSLLNTSCTNRLNKIYDYKPTKAEYSWGNVGAKLIGTYLSKKDETVKSIPYELFIWVELHSNNNSTVSISNIELINTQTNLVVYKNDKTMDSQFKQESDGKKIYSAYFSIKNLNIKYVQYKLVLDCQIKSETSFINERIELFFETDYKEYKSNDLWDMIMSV